MENYDNLARDYYGEEEYPSIEDIFAGGNRQELDLRQNDELNNETKNEVSNTTNDKPKQEQIMGEQDIQTYRNNQSEELSETLLVFDQEEQTLQAVKKIDKNGKLKTVEATEGNNSDFIKLDKQGDFLSNFYTNFVRQAKDPSRFRIFKVPIPRISYWAETIKNLLKNPTPENENQLKRYEVTPQVQHTGQHNVPENNNPQKTKTMETPTTTASEYRYKVEDIDWNTLGKMGVTQEKLEKMNLLDDLLKGFKTNQLVPVSLNLGSVITRTDARLSLQPSEEGGVVMAMHGIRKEPALHFPFFGHTFTEEDKKNLLQTGNMGRVVMLENRKTGESIPSIISIDRMTNELVALRADKIKIPEEIKGVKLSEEQKQTLLDGKSLFLEGMISKKGTEFSANVQFNADKRYVEFLFLNDNKQAQNQRQKQAPDEAPRFVRGKELSEEQYDKFKSGQTIYVDDLVDKKGQTYKGYLTFNVEKGKTEFSFGNPNKQKTAAKQTAQPDEAHKTQKAVNSDGKTNEATKHLREALQSGQTKPTEKQAEKQETKKSKGRKL